MDQRAGQCREVQRATEGALCDLQTVASAVVASPAIKLQRLEGNTWQSEIVMLCCAMLNAAGCDEFDSGASTPGAIAIFHVIFGDEEAGVRYADRKSTRLNSSH